MRSIFRRLPLTAPSRRPLPPCCTRWCTSTAWRLGSRTPATNGVYHNQRFKEQAEAHGLTVDHHEKYGWTITSPSEELLDFIIFQGWQDIQMGERLAWSDMAGTGAGSKAPGSSQTGAPKPPKAKSSTRRWVCPKCGTIIRSTKEVRVICADCMELFVKAD